MSCALGLLCFLTVSHVHAEDALDAILKIQRGGEGVAAASNAADELIKSGATFESLVSKAKGANPVSKNCLLSIAQTVIDRQPAEKVRQSLQRVLADKNADSDIRYWALDKLSEGRAERREKLLDGRTEDPSLDIRYEAIELALRKLPTADVAKAEASTQQKTVASYQQLLKAARLPEQINSIAAKLKELDTEVDLLNHFGFISKWQIIGPFDNRKEVGFNVAYPPEAEYLQTSKENIKERFPGKAAEVSWQPASTEKPDGMVDLNAIYNNEKGAVIYAYTTIESASDLACQVRLGSPNANKIWINGEESTVNNVYHTGTQIDQYVGPAKLKRGTNSVLVKICQNEQTDPWAQNFGFQLRFTDSTGQAIQLQQ